MISTPFQIILYLNYNRFVPTSQYTCLDVSAEFGDVSAEFGDVSAEFGDICTTQTA